ncbi:MAG: hypothetical protein R2705_02510 [Ilumatobacteraceae bacterium]
MSRYLAVDPLRVELLLARLEATLDELGSLRPAEPAAREAGPAIRHAAWVLEPWTGHLRAILADESLTGAWCGWRLASTLDRVSVLVAIDSGPETTIAMLETLARVLRSGPRVLTEPNPETQQALRRIELLGAALPSLLRDDPTWASALLTVDPYVTARLIAAAAAEADPDELASLVPYAADAVHRLSAPDPVTTVDVYLREGNARLLAAFAEHPAAARSLTVSVDRADLRRLLCGIDQDLAGRFLLATLDGATPSEYAPSAGAVIGALGTGRWERGDQRGEPWRPDGPDEDATAELAAATVPLIGDAVPSQLGSYLAPMLGSLLVDDTSLGVPGAGSHPIPADLSAIDRVLRLAMLDPVQADVLRTAASLPVEAAAAAGDLAALHRAAFVAAALEAEDRAARLHQLREEVASNEGQERAVDTLVGVLPLPSMVKSGVRKATDFAFASEDPEELRRREPVATHAVATSIGLAAVAGAATARGLAIDAFPVAPDPDELEAYADDQGSGVGRVTADAATEVDAWMDEQHLDPTDRVALAAVFDEAVDAALRGATTRTP